MDKDTQTLVYRNFVADLISDLKLSLFNSSGKTRFPTDASIAYMLGLTPTAFSNLYTRKSSASGLTLALLVSSLHSLGVSVSFPESLSRV